MRLWIAVVMVGCAIAACGPDGSSAGPGVASPKSNPSVDRTLIAGLRSEPITLAARAIGSQAFAGLQLAQRLPNAGLVLMDASGELRPYLAAARPLLHTQTWQVDARGAMETTWSVKPGIAWQDGTPLSTDDFVFAWHVYRVPEYGGGGSPLMRAIDDVTAPDQHTLVVHYRQPYPAADDLSSSPSDSFPPLPRHLLEPAFQQNDATSFPSNPFWTTGYVGVGPYKLDRWEPGSFLEYTAFDQHVLGRPKIGRIRVLFIGDANTAVSYVLGSQLDLIASGTTIGFEQAYALQQQWVPTGAGTVLLAGNLWRATAIELRPELASPLALLDARVRKALASSVDKQALNDSVYHGEMEVSDTFISPKSYWGPVIESAVVKYPYDLHQSAQFMEAAGFAKGSDGVFASATQGRFTAQLKTAAAPEWEAEVAIMGRGWRAAGFDVQEAILPAALSLDPASRVTFPAMFTSTIPQGDQSLASFTSGQIPRAENNWRGGNNRGGWSDLDYDRLFEAFSTTLETSQRAALLAQLMQTFTDQLPVIPLLALTQPYVYVSALHGIAPTVPEAQLTWNIHEWEWGD